MSRIGKLPINIPAGVTVTLKDNVVSVKGPKGELSQAVDPSIIVTIENNEITFAIDEANDGDILFIKTNNSNMSVWGELASTCAKANGVKATVIYGSVRDLDALYYMDYPIFACDYAPNAGSALGLGEINVDISVGDMTIQPGDFFYGDETGVVIIPQSLFKQVMTQTLAIKVKELGIIDAINGGKTLSQAAGLK